MCIYLQGVPLFSISEICPKVIQGQTLVTKQLVESSVLCQLPQALLLGSALH